MRLLLFFFSGAAWADDDKLSDAEVGYATIPSLNHSAAEAENIPEGAAFPDWSKRWLSARVNERKGDVIAEFVLKEDGGLLASPQELRKIGLAPAISAAAENGFMDISRLPHVVFDYNEEEQSIHFRTSADVALIPVEVSLSQGYRLPAGRAYEAADDGQPVAKSDFGALVNYAFYADTGSEKFSDLWRFSGLSGQFDARVFGRLGTFSSGQVVRFASGTYQNTVRLDTSWSYWDPERLTSYTAGDFVTGSLPWTSSVRMGGFQWRRNFAIRSDLVTMPLPSFSGSAAVPSSVDVYINNLRRDSTELPAGPWRLTDFPVVTGANEARLVVKDALGRETVTEVPFYASSNMLAKGLADFSVEGGFLRYGFGAHSDKYGKDFAFSATIRYGVSNAVTFETHGEYTAGLYNGGAGAVFTVGSLGVVSVSGAASRYRGKDGQQVAVSFETERWGMNFNAYSQTTSGDYNTLASATVYRGPWQDADGEGDDFYRDYAGGGKSIKSIHRVSVGMPLKFDPTVLNLSYTHSDYHNSKDKAQFLSLSASRRFGRRIFGYANAYKDFRHANSYGVFAGMSINLDNRMQLSTGVTSDKSGTSFQTEVSKFSNTQAVGSGGWRLRDVEGKKTSRQAYGTYTSRIARLEGSVEQNSDDYRLTAGIEGSVIAAGGGIFATNRISDSFAVVDVGAPGVSVMQNNSFYGKTNRSGKLIVPTLMSYQPARLSIKAEDMPLDTVAVATEMEVMPAYRTGVVANFTVERMDSSLLIAVLDENGEPVELGSLVRDRSGEERVAIGYDGQTVLPLAGVKLPASFVVQRANGGLCKITIPRSAALGITNGLTEVQCTPL